MDLEEFLYFCAVAIVLHHSCFTGTSMCVACGTMCASGLSSWSTAACCLERCQSLCVDISCLPAWHHISPAPCGSCAASDAWRHHTAACCRSAPVLGEYHHSRLAPPCSYPCLPHPPTHLLPWACGYHRSMGVGCCVGVHCAQLWEWHCVVCRMELQPLVSASGGQWTPGPLCRVSNGCKAVFIVNLPITVMQECCSVLQDTEADRVDTTGTKHLIRCANWSNNSRLLQPQSEGLTMH